MTGPPDALAAFVARTLDRPVPPEIAALAARVAARPGVAAVLFYGNMLRDARAGGLADLYALTDSDRAWGGAGPGALGNRLLPPNVYHLRAGGAAAVPPRSVNPAKAGISGGEARDSSFRGADARVAAARPTQAEGPPGPDGSAVNGSDAVASDGAAREATAAAASRTEGADRPAAVAGAKLAVMRLAAFRHRMRRDSWDTTLWARFAQPAALLYARDEAARAAVVEAIATGWRTAAWWGDRLAADDRADGDATAGRGDRRDGGDRWAALFAATYSAELRPEGTASRPAAITGRAPELYAEVDRLLPPAKPPAGEAAAARRQWQRRRRVGHALNAARLVKAAATFRGGAAYALSKIERHAGPGALRPWERRLPWLAAPLVLLRLLRRGGLR